MKIILGSQSPRRKKVLREMGFAFEIIPADIDERAIREDKPEKLVLAIAKAKAEALKAKIFEPAILITADTIIVWEKKLLEKPKNEKEARKFLLGYNAHPVVTAVTGIVVANLENNKQAEEADAVKIHFNHFSVKDIDELIARGGALDLAGGFEVNGKLWEKHIRRIDGQKDSAMGLSKKIVKKLINTVTA